MFVVIKYLKVIENRNKENEVGRKGVIIRLEDQQYDKTSL